MYKATHLISIAPGTDEAARNDLIGRLQASAPSAARVHVAPTLPGVFNGRDLIVHHQFENAAGWNTARSAVDALLADPLVSGSERVAYEDVLVRDADRTDAGGGVYRALLLSVRPGVEEDRVRRFEAELAEMPSYIRSIRNWQLSRVAEADGTRPWTHVWEQEYDSMDGLMGPYMIHPHHWAWIDRWFDPEGTDWIVDTQLCHTFCAIEDPII